MHRPGRVRGAVPRSHPHDFNFMKTKLFSLTLAIAALAFTGCASTGPATGPGPTSTITPEQRAARVGTVAEVAAYTGATASISAHPESRPYFISARIGLGELLGSTNIPPADISAAVADLPIKELKGQEGNVSLGINTALILYDALLRENVNLDGNAYLRPVITGLYQGLTRATQ